MLHLIPSDPVGLPGLAAMAVGLLAFFSAMMMARMRARRNEVVPVARKATASWIWIAVQGVGVGIAGFGRITVSLDPLSPRALVEAAVVLVLILGAVWLFHASSRTMGKNWSLVARTREDHQLVQTGPFAVVRHPIYVAIFLFMLALAMSYGHTRNLLVAVPVYVVATLLRVRYEETLLREQFGPAYDAYAARVKRFVPGVF
jgi:protein-S-isoprenylcysteine O-methyltransferase Ste14